jgi:hypothetical protein
MPSYKKSRVDYLSSAGTGSVELNKKWIHSLVVSVAVDLD